MKKFLTIILFLVACLSAGAQSKFDARPKKPFFISAQGGLLVSVNENVFTYVKNQVVTDLITPQGSVQLGFYMNNHFSMRASVGYGRNASAANSMDTKGQGFYPYRFDSINAFLDFGFDFLNRNTTSSFFLPRIYLGGGYAHTFNFTDSGHPWQVIRKVNNTFGFRLGFVGEFQLSNVTSVILDLCGEAYGDWYNGLRPSAGDQSLKEGYAGFPLDLRGCASLGILFHL